MGIELHDVPEDGETANLNHRFGPEFGFLAQYWRNTSSPIEDEGEPPGAMSAWRQNRLQEVFTQLGVERVENPHIKLPKIPFVPCRNN